MMFAFIYFNEDASLTVVGKNDKKLTIETEFAEREPVSMKWGKQTYHGSIIKIHETEEELTKFANQAYSKVLKDLPEKPTTIPESLFSFTIREGKVKGKRNRTQTDKFKESQEQEEELSPKKNKKIVSDATKGKEKKISPRKLGKGDESKTPAKEKIEKKKLEETAAQKSAIYISDVLTQLIDSEEDDTPSCTQQVEPSSLVKPTCSLNVGPSLQPQSFSTERSNSVQSQQSVTREEPVEPMPQAQPFCFKQVPVNIAPAHPQFSPQYVGPAPSNELQPLYSGIVESNVQPVSSQKSSEINSCYNKRAESSSQYQFSSPVELQTPRQISMLDTWNLCTQTMDTQQELPSRELPVPSSEVLKILKGLQRPDVLAFLAKVVEHFETSSYSLAGNVCVESSDNKWTLNSDSVYQNIEESDQPVVQPLPLLSTPLRRSPRKHSRKPPPPETITMAAELNSTPQKQLTEMNTSKGNNFDATGNPSTPGTGSEGISSPSRSDENNGMEILLKAYPGVKVRSEVLRNAIRLAKKSLKPGYTLCYNLLLGVFTCEEIANSRGQGLTKPKPGDLRMSLKGKKMDAIKDYATRWCRKNGKDEPSVSELNNAVTEQVSHCRKKLKRAISQQQEKS